MRQNPTNRSDYNYFSKMNTRWNDNDIYGHLNNVIYYELFDTAVNKWLIKNNLIDIKKGNNIGLIVQSGCNYFSSFEYPEDIDAGIRVTKIGNSSVRYEVGLFKSNDDLASADGFFIHVYVDRVRNKPINLDYEFKSKEIDVLRDGKEFLIFGQGGTIDPIMLSAKKLESEKNIKITVVNISSLPYDEESFKKIPNKEV